MPYRPYFILAALFATAVQAAEPVPVGPELLPNPGLEAAGDPAEGWVGFTTRDWGDVAGEAVRETDDPHGGQACVRLQGVRVRYALAVSGIVVDPDTAYLLTGWVRTRLRTGESAYLAASWSNEERWLSLSASQRVIGTTRWTQVALVLPPAKRTEGATRLQVSFRVESQVGQGQAWVDDLSLRACELPPPPPRIEQERARQQDLVKALAARDGDWQRRLHSGLPNPDTLVGMLDGEAGQPQGLVNDSLRDQLASGQRAAGQAWLPAALAAAADLPATRQECLRILTMSEAFKQSLSPAARTALLRAEAKALAMPRSSAARPKVNPNLPAVGDPDGSLALAVVQPGYSTEKGAALGTLAVDLRAETPGRLEALLVGPAGDAVYRQQHDLVMGRTTFSIQSVQPWFPDCPHRYDLTLVLYRDGEPVDKLTKNVAFRDVRVVESDLSGTLRHAWDLGPTDYSFLINGQIWFPRGTVCNDLSRNPDETVELFDELWLDFQRQYGDTMSWIGGPAAQLMVAKGKAFLTSLGPDYNDIRTFESAESGMEYYRERCREVAGLLSDPAVLAVQVGNEEELAVWGAALPSVYADDLWHVFTEFITCLREEAQPAMPVSYVRAAHYGSVLPAPGEDYSGVNQYTGRYWGSRRTIAADLSTLSLAAYYDDAPFGVTEWNGPKYSWATRGVSGVDEAGSASYIFDYWRELQRATGSVLSTEFVLNWVVTPVEDLTSVPLEEGLQNRAKWEWSLQQGTPWYPRIWPDLLTDTPARRAMRGFDSPLFDLAEAPGTITILAEPTRDADADKLKDVFARLGRDATVAAPGEGELAGNILLLGGLGDAQPDAVRRLERMGVLGRTDTSFPAAGEFTIQRRLNPDQPDRMLVAVTAADEAGWQKAVAKLLDAGQGLEEAYARKASQRRVLALIPDSDQAVTDFERYVVELPTRGYFLARDDVRRSITAAELDEVAGWDLGLVIVAVDKPLDAAVRQRLLAMAERGITVVWSAATVAADDGLAKLLGISFGPRHRLDGPVPVADWAREPLTVPDMGSVSLARIKQFGNYTPDEGLGAKGLWASAVQGDGWQAAATAAGQPVVVRKGRQWVFGVDLASAARVLCSVTQRGVNHSIYDRDTANGLERIFRLVTNAGLLDLPPRPADTPRLRAVIQAPMQAEADQPLAVTVKVFNQAGEPADATVRLGIVDPGRSNYGGIPQQFTPARREATGEYSWTATPEMIAALGELTASSYRGLQRLGIFASVDQAGMIGDWLATTIRMGDATDEAARIADLADRVRNDLVEIPFHVETKDTWIELDAALRLPGEMAAGQPLAMTLSIKQVESDEGNDWLEDVALVLTSEQGTAVELPVLPGKLLASAKAPPVAQRPGDCVVVTSSQPATVPLVWSRPQPGRWSVSLRYKYTDHYHIADTDKLPRDDPFEGLVLVIGKEQ